MSDIKVPDAKYFNTLLNLDPPVSNVQRVDLENGSPSKLTQRIYVGKESYIWRQTNHKDVRIQQFIAERHPDLIANIVDSLAQGSPQKVNESNPGWLLYSDLGGNGFIEGQFIDSILEALIVVHGHYGSYRNDFRYVPEYRPKLLGQAIRCHILPPIKYLVDNYTKIAGKLLELWTDTELIVYNYRCITEVFTAGDLTLVHGAISSDSIFIDEEGKCKFLNWAGAHWATPYIDLCRLLSLGFEFDHLFQYMERLQKRTNRRIDEQLFAFCVNVSIVHVLLERVSWRVRQLRVLSPQQLEKERDLQAEVDLVHRLLLQGITIFKDLQPEAIELGYETWKNIKL